MSDVVERAKAALEGVTGGPWVVDNTGYMDIIAMADTPNARYILEFDPAPKAPEDAEFVAAARTLVPELIAEIEQLQRGSKTLGEIVESQCRMALDASGLHHLIDEDGDGDWGAVWEKLAELGAEVERLRAVIREVAK